MYYSCLDGNWNNNTNDKWGEARLDFPWCKTPVWDDIDWGYDVTLGRILVDSTNEANAWITRLKGYVDGNDYTKGNYLNNSMVAGKSPSNQIDPYVWDQLNDEFPSNISFVNNYTITQPQWSVMDDYCNGAIAPYGGINILYHSGHGGTETPYLTANLNNSDKPQGLFYTEGCQTADFGASTTTRTENLFSGAGGFVCGISNSAYGWFIASTWYSEEMFRLMFNTSSERCFAKAHDEARVIFGHTAHSVCSQLVKETIFFGDPALEYKFYTPEQSPMLPANNTGYETVYNVTLSATASQNGNISFYWANGTLISTIENITIGQIAEIHLPDYLTTDWLHHDTTYYWYVINNGTRDSTWNFHTSKAWDLNEDRTVNALDVSGLITHYRAILIAGSQPWDINNDGKVNALDTSALASHYRETY
jgi:hypothetical protein